MRPSTSTLLASASCTSEPNKHFGAYNKDRRHRPPVKPRLLRATPGPDGPGGGLLDRSTRKPDGTVPHRRRSSRTLLKPQPPPRRARPQKKDQKPQQRELDQAAGAGIPGGLHGPDNNGAGASRTGSGLSGTAQ